MAKWSIEEVDVGNNKKQLRIKFSPEAEFPAVIVSISNSNPKDIIAYYESDPRLRYISNENGTGIRWLSEIKRYGVVGLKYLWASDVFPNPYSTNTLLDAGDRNLQARLISVVNDSSTFKTKYYVSVIWPIDNKNGNIDYAGQYGIERMIKDRYQLFEEFVDSIRFPGE